MSGLNSTDPSSYRDSSGHIISPYYGYLPTRSVCMMFVALFGISTLTHVVQALWTRKWWLLYTICLAGSGEILGWSGRLWSSYNTLNQTPYTIQVVVTILAPTPLVAALFITFSRITEILGTCYSRLSPRWYSRIFLTCDIIALFVQASGGALASNASTNSLTNLGSNIMLGGIVFQLVSLVIFSLFMAEYYFRYIHDRPVRSSGADLPSSFVPAREPVGLQMKWMARGLCASTFFLFVRSIYRTIELADGFNGRIIKTQVYFSLFDGAMVLLAIWTLNFMHPGFLLGPRPTVETIVMQDKRDGSSV